MNSYKLINLFPNYFEEDIQQNKYFALHICNEYQLDKFAK